MAGVAVEALNVLPQPGVIAFSHANGFPAGTYRLLFEAWRAVGYRVIAIDKIGHDPKFPVTSNWPHLRDALIQLVEQQAGGEPVHFVGHSMGGYLSLLAASKRPGLARSVVMLDAPLVGGWRAQAVRWMKTVGLVQRMGPGRVSTRRRAHWPSAQAALKHFSSKAVFAAWQPEVLRDYVNSTIEPDTDSNHTYDVRLAFKREVETRLYNTLPHHMQSLLRRQPLQCPVAYIGGTRSLEAQRSGLAPTQALVGRRLVMIEGGHLFPMEKPVETAQAVLRFLDSGQPMA
jgi:pimeloyl-ACP methyl ester carboxylesterase